MPLSRRNGYRYDVVRDPSLVNHAPAYVYAFTDGEAVKVGHSRHNPRLRVRALQTGNSRPFTLVAFTVGTTEAEVHRRLDPWRVRGGGREWFELCGEVLEELRGWAWLDVVAYKALLGKIGGREEPDNVVYRATSSCVPHPTPTDPLYLTLPSTCRDVFGEVYGEQPPHPTDGRFLTTEQLVNRLGARGVRLTQGKLIDLLRGVGIRGGKDHRGRRGYWAEEFGTG